MNAALDLESCTRKLACWWNGPFECSGRGPSNPLASKQPHYPGKAKAVIHLFMAGAPSHLDLFDYKPDIAKLEGKPLPESVIMGNATHSFGQMRR